MAVEVTLDSPLAKQLQNAVQSKIVEAGWSGMDDTGLSEYIVLMVVNGKSEGQVATELSTDLLDMSPEDAGVADFSRWLFEQVELLAKQPNDPSAADNPAQAAQLDVPADADMEGANDGVASSDATAAQSGGSIPTGPKSMRDTSTRGRDKRGGGPMNRNSARAGETAMHRIKGAANRINSHARDAPRGPAPKGPRGNMRGNVNAGRMQNAVNNQMNALAGQTNGFPGFGPEQQMQMLAMQQQMMAQFMTPEQQQQFFAMGMGAGMNGMGMGQDPMPGGKSLFDRIDGQPRSNGHGHFKHRQQHGHFKQKGDTDAMDLTSSMEAEGGSQSEQRQDAAATVCRYNLFCTRPDCPFAHQSPAAPPDTTVDLNDTCTYGAACTNQKCTGKHPSPAKRSEHASESMCRYWPNCTNPHCHFSHPKTPLCRNGADCNVTDCKFAHPTITCKYNPCLNPACPYKHAEGQKRGNKPQGNVWINPGTTGGDKKEDGGGDHVSERKFVDESAEEEMVVPGQGDSGADASADMAATEAASIPT